jgi:hypothetical protein
MYMDEEITDLEIERRNTVHADEDDYHNHAFRARTLKPNTCSAIESAHIALESVAENENIIEEGGEDEEEDRIDDEATIDASSTASRKPSTLPFMLVSLSALDGTVTADSSQYLEKILQNRKEEEEVITIRNIDDAECEQQELKQDVQLQEESPEVPVEFNVEPTVDTQSESESVLELSKLNIVVDVYENKVRELTVKKLTQLLSVGTQTLMADRTIQLASDNAVDHNRKYVESHRKRAYPAEHRIEGLIKEQDHLSITSSLEHAAAIARYGEQRILNQIEADTNAIVNAVPTLSSKILERRYEVNSAFDNADMVRDIAEKSFTSLKSYYHNCQNKLNSKYSSLEKTYLQYELDSLGQQIPAMRQILDNAHLNEHTKVSRGDNQRRCDELYRKFCDRTLELTYKNSTMKQDYEWRFQEAKDMANKWRYQISAEMQLELNTELNNAETSYARLVDSLHQELQRLRQSEHFAVLEKKRLRNLANIPPFALQKILREKDEAVQAQLHAQLKNSKSATDNLKISKKIPGNSYRVHTGTHLVQLACASGMTTETLAKELQDMLSIVAPHVGGAERLENVLHVMNTDANQKRNMANLLAIPIPTRTV